MISWHDYSQEHPAKNGDYLVVTDLDEDSNFRYGQVSIMRFYKRGTLVPYLSRDHYFPNDESPSASDLTHVIANPDYWTASEGFYDREDNLEDAFIHKPIGQGKDVFWADLPAIPAPYDGDQNAYLDEWFARLPEEK